MFHSFAKAVKSESAHAQRSHLVQSVVPANAASPPPLAERTDGCAKRVQGFRGKIFATTALHGGARLRA